MILGKDSKLFPQYYQAFQNQFFNIRFGSDYKMALDIIKDNNFGAIVIIDDDLNGMSFDRFLIALENFYNQSSTFLKIYKPHKHSETILNVKKRKHIDIIWDDHILKKELGITHTFISENNSEIKENNSNHFLHQLKILLVEDEMRNIFVLDSVFEPYNCILTIANNGQEALDILNNNADFDIILMDIMMPIMNGFEAIELIRNTTKLKELNIIAVTAKAMSGDAEKCLEAGANAYVSKPIDIDLLFSTMRSLIIK